MKKILLVSLLIGLFMNAQATMCSDYFYENGLCTKSEWQVQKAREAEVKKNNDAKRELKYNRAMAKLEAESEAYKAKKERNSAWGKVKGYFSNDE